MTDNKLLPLLDGLDELGLPRQQRCIDKINDFLQNNSSWRCLLAAARITIVTKCYNAILEGYLLLLYSISFRAFD